ncbi:unnamed protein product [Gongylonema pulchrum]|uniref:Peptidase_M24 domain-containing protein n=1 Tax=Gongylonema pulchrum TaxID=637853 RepID=A0A183EX96_9BILA|nr:unnamed protein product [Gongylonema pulchrum]
MDEIRSRQPLFVDASFETIAAVNEHAALPHYRSDPETGKMLITNSSVFLLDSGGHYRDGTTDVTRTVAFPGNADKEFSRMFTLFSGIRLDSLSRQSLWADGLDFEHGVGHGVGHFLNVHEGPGKELLLEIGD